MAARDSSPSSQSEEKRSSSRRALLGAGVGALAATLAAAIGRPAPVRAEGETMVVGGEYTTATSRVLLRNEVNDNGVFVAESTGAGVGVSGLSNSWIGVSGNSSSYVGVRGNSNPNIGVWGSSESHIGVYGSSISNMGVQGFNSAATQPATVGWAAGHSTGVLGYSSGGGTLPAAKAKTGVYGEATQDSGSRGVWGRATSGQGVRGAATGGVGVFGTATSGYAIRGDGRLRFDKVSGVATIAAGATSVVVNPGVNVTSSSFVLLTPRHNIGSRGLWYVPDTTNDRFTIRLSSSRSSSTLVAWLLVG